MAGIVGIIGSRKQETPDSVTKALQATIYSYKTSASDLFSD
jgi:hypothetical protein